MNNMLRYYCEYEWLDKRQHRIEIYDRDYEGEPEEIRLVGDGYVSETGRRDNDIIEPISVSKSKLYIYDKDEKIRNALYTTDPDKYTVIHYIKDYPVPVIDQLINAYRYKIGVSDKITKTIY